MTFQRKMHKALSVLVLFSFVSGQILPPAAAAQPASVLNLPMPGAMVGVSPKYVPIAIKGIKIFPDNPFRFDFLLDTGNSNLNQERLNEETKILIKYFLTALTISDQDQWVNLSPVEHDRIVPNEFGVTEMGRDLLAQDYLLKQLTASLIYPEHELGKKFWENVYRKAYEKYGDADIPMSTFNKVWIMPDHATVYQNGNTAVITESRLKVLLEEDYLALSKGVSDSRNPRDPGTLGTGEPRDYNTFGSQIVREIVLPEIEREVNEGKNFARLRQVYRSMIMAAWFKRKLKDGIINKMYVGQNKVAGVDVADKEIKEKVYQQYLAAYKKGVYNYIKEDVDPRTHAVVPRKYFSGGIKTGVEVGRTTEMITVNPDQLASAAGDVTGDSLTASIGLNPVDSTGKGVEILNRPEISLPIDVKRRLDDNVGFLMDIVKAVQSSVAQRGGGIYQYHLYLNNTEPSRQTLPEKFRERFQEIDDPQEIRYFARALSREWKNNGFDNDFGSVFEYVAQTLSDYVGTPSQIKKMYAWMYTFLEESEPLERVYALRLLIVSFINHLRRNGLHPENENNQFGLSDEKFPLDMELLLGNPRDLQGEQIVQRYILGLLELQKTSQWTEVIPGIDGQPNKLGLTNEDMLLWGLALAVDPTIYYEGVDEESRPYPMKDIGVYLSKYFGEEVNEQNAGVKFLQRAFSHESLKDKRPQIEVLLIKALGISDQQWADKGQRSPYRFAFNLDYLGSIFTGTSIWDESLRILGNPMLMLGFDFSYWSGPSKLMLQPSSNSTRHLILRKQGEQGLRPLYVHAFASPELAAIFPDLAAIIRGEVNGIPGGALKDLSVFDPDKPAPEPAAAVLEQWKIQASTTSVQTLMIAGQEITAKIIEVESMTAGMTAYHFIEPDKMLDIVIAANIKEGEVRNEVIFHEAMEANWSDLLMAEAKQPLTAEGVTKTKRDVHILAWAEQVVSFGQSSLTPLHQQQIALLSVEDREALKAEKTREYQDALIKQYFPLDRYEEYLKYKQRFQDALTKSAAPASVDPALIPKVGTLLTEESLQALAQFNLLNAEGLKRMLPVGKIVTADFLEGVAMLARLLNVEPGPNFGIRGGALARTDKDIYSALSDMLNVYSGNLSFEDRERLAATLARMKEGSLQLLNIMGVINDNEFELLKSKDATGLKNLNAESKQEFLDRLAALVGSFDGLAKTNKTGLMIRLVPLKVIDLLMEYFGSSRATVQTVIRGHPDFPAWLVAAELKVQSIQKLVSGPRNAWIVVQAQGLEKTDEWIEKARVIVDKIQPLVGSRGQAWHIIIIQGIDKAGDWAEKAHVKVLAIQDKVGGSSNAWQIVVRQGIEKVDAWVEKAQKKVSAILPVVGSETNAWLILIGLGTDGTDAWLKSRKQQAEELQRSGQTVTTAWKNIIRTSLFSDEDGGLENGRMSGDTATESGQSVTVRVAAAPLNGKPQPVIPSGESPELLIKRKYVWETMSRMRLASGEIITLLEHDHSRYGGGKPSSEQRPGIIVFPGDFFLQGIDYVQDEFRLMLPFVNSQEHVDAKSGETFTIKSEFYPETGFTYHEIFRKDGTEAGQFTDPRMGNNSQDPAAAIMRRYDRVRAARAGRGEADLVGAVRMDYLRVMTKEEIDRRIDEIPKEFRKWFGFGSPENDGEVPVKFQAGESESEWLAFSNVTGFTIGKLGMGDALYVASLKGDQIEINVFWIKYDSAGSGRPKPVLDAVLVDKKDLPLNVSKEFNIELDEDTKWSAARTLMAGASLQAGFGMGYYERMEDELILAMGLIGEPDTVPYYELGNWPENRIELRKDFTLIREEIWSVKWGQYITALIDNDQETAKRVLDEARNGPIRAPLGHNVEEIGAALTDPVIREKLIRMFEQQQAAQDGFFDEAEGQEEIDTPYYSGAMLKTDLETMGLKEGATREELDQAKRKLNSLYYPDRVREQGQDLLEAGRKQQEINDAYARLKKHPWFSDKTQNNPQEEINPGDQASDGESNKGLPGGALKQIGILGDRQSLQVPAEILNRWNDLAKDVQPQSFEIAGEKFTARIVRAAVMPQGLFAYNFRDGQNQLVIVLSDDLTSQEERNEAIYHEFREDYWLSTGQNDWAAHVLAAAEESIAFGQNGTIISPYHTKQIENLTGLQRGQLIEENRERNHLIILDALGQEKFDEYVRYENLIRAELKRIDVEVLRRDRGEEEFSLQLPAERFGPSVDLGRLMEEAGVEVLGYVPLFSVFGSYTYMRTPDGSVDWDHVGDLDIRIHARKSLSFKQYLDFRTRLFEKLKAVQGLVVDSPGMDDPQRRGDSRLYWAIKDIKTNNSIVLNTQMGNLDDVFAGTGSFMSYRVTDRFFGDVSEINALTNNLSVNDMLQTTVRFYLETIGELKMAISEPYTSTLVLGKLKTFYQLAVMRGKGEEYRWLIGEIDRFNDQIKRNAFDPVDFGKVTARALQGLDVSQDVFVPDLASVFRAGSFGAKAKDPLDIQIEVPVFVGIDAVSLIDEESRRSQYQAVRNAVIEKVKAAFASSQEDGFALGRSIERLAGASVDSIFDALKKSSGDPVRLQALIREAKISLSYTLDPRWNTFKLSLSDTGEGMSIEYLNALRREYKELQKPGLIGVRTYEALYSMIGPAMADNRWNEIEVVTRVLGTPQAYRFTTGRGDQPSVNDYFWQSDHGTRVTINGRSSRQRPQFAIEADAGGAKNFQSPVDESDAPFNGERLEMSLFDRGIDYVPYDGSAPSERSEDRSKMLERLAARAQNAMIGSLVATDVPTVPEGKEYLLDMFEEFYYNGVDAVLQKLDSMEPSQRESAVGQAKLTYSYREDLQTNQFEIVLSDVGTGISAALLNDWKEERFGSTKPSRDEDRDEEFKGPYFGHTGFGMNVNLRDAEDLGYMVTIVTRTPDGVTRKFVQSPDGHRTVTQMAQGRADFGTDVIITGEMIGGSSAGKTSAFPVQSTQDNALGGIDMNQNALNLKTEGQDIKFDMPFDPAQWENIKIEGFTPVILQINTTNLPLFIGANEPDKTIQLSSV